MNKTSIIITAHNYASYLEQAVDSAISQTVAPKEVIVVDDASDDNPEKVMKKYAGNPAVSFHSVGFRNAQKARNFGLEKAAGEYLLLLDADDYLREDFLEKTQAIFDKHPDISCVYSDRINFGNERLMSKFNQKKDWKTDNFSYDELRKRNYISLPSLFRNDSQARFDERINRFQDWDFWISYLKGRNAYHLGEPLFYVRFHGKNKTFAPNKFVERTKVKMKHGYLLGKRMVDSHACIPAKRNKNILVILKARENYDAVVEYLKKLKSLNSRIFLLVSNVNQETNLPVNFTKKIESLGVFYRVSRTYGCDELCNFLSDMKLVPIYKLGFLVIIGDHENGNLADLVPGKFASDVLWSSTEENYLELKSMDQANWIFNKKGIKKFLNL